MTPEAIKMADALRCVGLEVRCYERTNSIRVLTANMTVTVFGEGKYSVQVLAKNGYDRVVRRTKIEDVVRLAQARMAVTKNNNRSQENSLAKSR